MKAITEPENSFERIWKELSVTRGEAMHEEQLKTTTKLERTS